MANENLKKQMVVKLGTTTNTEAQLISNMVDGALSGKGGNDPELENLKKQMVIKLGTTTNEDAQIISNMVDNAAGGGGGGSSIPMMTLTIIAPEGTTEVKTYGWVCFDNNNNMLQTPILTEGENIIKMLYMQEHDEVFPFTYRNIGTHTFSNLINCILDEDAILITDPTIDSSATLTITSWEDIG